MTDAPIMRDLSHTSFWIEAMVGALLICAIGAILVWTGLQIAKPTQIAECPIKAGEVAIVSISQEGQKLTASCGTATGKGKK